MTIVEQEGQKWTEVVTSIIVLPAAVGAIVGGSVTLEKPGILIGISACIINSSATNNYGGLDCRVNATVSAVVGTFVTSVQVIAFNPVAAATNYTVSITVRLRAR